MSVKKGDVLEVEYEGSLDDGKIFDSTKGRGPLRFTVGEKQVIKGFEDGVLGMVEGEEKTFTLTPQQGYGEINPELFKTVSKNDLPEDVEEGATVMAELDNGHHLPVKVVKVDDDTVTVDLNHQLAGKNITFKIKVLSINT